MLVVVFRPPPGMAPNVLALEGVTKDTFQQLIEARSSGKFYTMNIWNRYPSEAAEILSSTEIV